MEIDKFINSFLIFFLFAILSSLLYFKFAMQTTQFAKIFNESVNPNVLALKNSLSGFSTIFTANCTNISQIQFCTLKQLPTNDTSTYGVIHNGLNAIANVVISFANIPYRLLLFILLFLLTIINFISLFTSIIAIIPSVFGALNVFNIGWVSIVFTIALLMVVVYLVWKLLEYIHGLI